MPKTCAGASYSVLDNGKLRVCRVSPFSGSTNSMDIEVSEDDLVAFYTGKREGLIQSIFPNLSPDEREFLKSGYTPEDWKNIFC